MDNKYREVELYAVLNDTVLKILEDDDIYFVKLKWIAHKYGSVKEVFLNAYRWYAQEASKIVTKPEEAESAVWTFMNLRYVDKHPENTIVKLLVPIEEAVFFRMSDWNKILNLRYVGRNIEEESAFGKTLEKSGVQYEGDIYNTPYYPHLKKQLTDSWNNLFRFDERVKQGDAVEFEDMQAGLWCLKKEWMIG